MRRVLYDLAGAEEDRRFSPYCWRTKLALAHKGLAFETVPWRFSDKEAIAFSGQGLVPVLVEGGRTVSDSWAIALELEERYPNTPSLFGGPEGRVMAHFVNAWTDRVLNPAVGRMMVLDIYGHLHEKDRAYFRATREARYGAPLEQLVADREARLPELRALFAPVRTALAQGPFLGGASPRYVDYIVFSVFQWARCISPFVLLQAEDPVFAWRERMLDAHGGLARKAKGYPVA
ncbi:glutathione S-transferase family protein [Archangium violaceum]|uniref:glutathione S-transferase family protein n=1 Tax=Archangium violaceum TaxID=83451 RepID=UPI002B300C8D|nr:glutathione S-transferase family protein [Archangium violaceum]